MSMLTNQEIEFLNKKYEKPTNNNSPILIDKKIEKNSELKSDPRSQKAPAYSRSFVNPRAPIKKVVVEIPAPTEILLAAMTPAEFAEKVHQPTNEVILTLLRWGIIAPKNSMLDEAAVERLATHYEIAVTHPIVTQEHKDEILVSDKPEVRVRPPVLVILGHVDHGKTTL